jgi:type IV secretion system protein VirB9
MPHLTPFALSAVFSICTLSTMATAEITPSVSPTDDRVRTVVYTERQVYRIDTKVLTATTIEFGPGEEIINVALGDNVGFTYGQLGDNSLAVKPTQAGVQTNMSVATTRGTYVFEMIEGARRPMYLVEFAYPKSGSRTKSAVRGPSVNSRTYYVKQASLATGFMPARIWDDGIKTYMQFSQNAAMPAAFRADGNGREYSVQSKIENGVMIIPSVQDRWVLRLGDSEICIWSDRLRAALARQ